MTNDPTRLIAKLHDQINEERARREFAENQIGTANTRYLQVKDQYEAHMAGNHYLPGHKPAVAPLSMEGCWGVFCEACSYEAEDYVYPCRAASSTNFPPRILMEPVIP